MEVEIKQLNTLLNNKTRLCNEVLSGDNTTLIDLLLKLKNDNYIFTENQIDRIMIQCFYYKSIWRAFFARTSNPDYISLIEYIMTNPNINQKHIDTIINFHKKIRKIDNWIQILFKIKYNFTVSDLYELDANRGITSTITNYDTIHNNVIYIAAKCIIIPDGAFKKCLKLFEEYTGSFNMDHFEIICDVINGHSYISEESNKKMKMLFNILFKNYDDKDQILQFMIDKNIASKCIINYIINRFGYNDTYLQRFLNNIDEYSYNYDTLFNLANKGYTVTLNDLNLVLNNDTSHIKFSYGDDYKNINISCNFIKKNDLTGIKLLAIDFFELFNIEPDINTLNIFCKNSSYYDNNELCIDILLNKYKIIPTEETLRTCIIYSSNEIITKILKYKIIPTVEMLYTIPEEYVIQSTTIELLINNGLTLNEQDINFLIEHNIFLDNLERFGIKYDEDLYFAHYLKGYFIIQEIKKYTIDQIILQLHQLCKTRRLDEDKLILFLKTNNIKLDRFCLEYLYMYNTKVYRRICLKHPDCTLPILTMCNLPYVKNMSKSKIARKYNITAKDMFEQYDMKL
jgi:hypothetical protein